MPDEPRRPGPAPRPESHRFRSRRSQDACSGIGHECLEKAALFKGRDQKFLQNLIQLLEIEVFAPGDVIMEEGDDGDKMYFLHRGSVEVLLNGNPTPVATLQSGSVFGEMALFGARRRAATIRSLEFCDCRVVNHVGFHILLQRFPEERKFFLEMARERLERLGQLKQKSENVLPPPATPARRSSMPSNLTRRRSSTHLAPEPLSARRASTSEQLPPRRFSRQGAQQDLSSKEEEEELEDWESSSDDEEGISEDLKGEIQLMQSSGQAAAAQHPPLRLLEPLPELPDPPLAGPLLPRPTSEATTAMPSSSSTPPVSASSSRPCASAPSSSSKAYSPRPPSESGPAKAPRGALAERLRLGNAELRAGLEQLQDEVQQHGGASSSRRVTLDSLPFDSLPASARGHSARGRRSSGARCVSTMDSVSISTPMGSTPGARCVSTMNIISISTPVGSTPTFRGKRCSITLESLPAACGNLKERGRSDGLVDYRSPSAGAAASGAEFDRVTQQRRNNSNLQGSQCL